MDRQAAVTTTFSAFVRWEEVHESSERGRREVHYYLKREDGTSDLAVVGKEKSFRHMSYHYAIRNRTLLSLSPSSSLLKLRSRREVVDWLNSIVQDMPPHRQSEPIVDSSEERFACKMDLETLRDVQSRNLGKHTTEFLWLGSAWTCRKKRRHYQSFRRNGVKISVHDFVYVLAEEDKRLVAYLDDMYEDSRGNKMVVVRWFHKIDEVGSVLPRNYNDREIFFSLCLQDLSIECIDGLAAVLGPQHYNKFLNEATYTQLSPFLCNSQFDNDEPKPFDISQVKGYWNQEILKYIFGTSTPLTVNLESQPSIDSQVSEENCNDFVAVRPKKRLRRARDCDLSLKSAGKQNAAPNACFVVPNFSDSLGVIKGCRRKEGEVFQKPQHLTMGARVEVLSQDSGIRGCWFRASIIKKHKEKVKVRYQDLKDAADESKNLEEWILASRVAVHDDMGIRMNGRVIVRPSSPFSEGIISSIGSIVDAWWNDGWWEGIVLRKESEDRILVYFPGEKRESIFSRYELRSAHEWLGSRWKHLKDRPELATSILFSLENPVVKSSSQSGLSCDSLTTQCKLESGSEKLIKDKEAVRDLLKDEILGQLKWSCSRKRRNCSKSFCGKKKNYRVVVSSSSSSSSKRKSKSRAAVLGAQTCEKFFIRSSLKVDHDNCSKYIEDPVFSTSVVSSLTNLVMSR